MTELVAKLYAANIMKNGETYLGSPDFMPIEELDERLATLEILLDCPLIMRVDDKHGFHACKIGYGR